VSAPLVEYYGRRASEYERVYHKPERQSDLGTRTLLLQQLLAGEDVLEIACGTGYWTAVLAPVVHSMVSTDASPPMLALARRKSYPPDRVRLELADAYAPAKIEGRFTAGFGGFWWSHVPREDLPRFLSGLHSRLGSGARVVFCDNRFAEGSSTPIERVDAAGNTYQRRRLENGEEYEVLKNFPSAAELVGTVAARGGTDFALTELTYYWCLTYRVSTLTP
jgi:demethylmenaquinone methyltransferase/2-methoxy-6-polyprenyl-1,4-benzoquinol methylase